MENSAHLIYQQQNTKNASSKKAASSRNTNANPLSALQDLAKHLGSKAMRVENNFLES